LKFNLTNFPVKGTPQAYERWGKGFEKELRKMLWSTVPDLEIQGWNKALKKILGEAT